MTKNDISGTTGSWTKVNIPLEADFEWFFGKIEISRKFSSPIGFYLKTIVDIVDFHEKSRKSRFSIFVYIYYTYRCKYEYKPGILGEILGARKTLQIITYRLAPVSSDLDC